MRHCSEGVRALFLVADATGVIMVTAHVLFATLNCFCKEMGVFGQVGGEAAVYKRTWLHRKPFPVINRTHGSNVTSYCHI
jgi:hypothetical protein